MEIKKRLIDANALRVYRGINVGANLGGLRAIVLEKDIRNAPTVDAVEVVHGRWEKIDDFDGEFHWRCSACGVEWFFYEEGPQENGCNYCPRCGAKMDGGSDEGL